MSHSRNRYTPNRSNPGTPAPSEAAVRSYERMHWGIKPDKYHVVHDPMLPPNLVEMGKLKEIKLLAENPDGRAHGAGLTLQFGPGCLLCWEPNRMTRLYNVLTPETEREVGRLLQAHGLHRVPWVPLRHLATFDEAGVPRRNPKGRQAVPGSYPAAVRVQPVGIVEHVVYHTHKKGDGPSHYIHELGEETGIRPWLGRDDEGRLWWAGGAYEVTEAGVCD